VKGTVAAVVAVLGWSVYATIAHGVNGSPVFSVLVWAFVAAALATGLAAWIDARRTGVPFRTSPRSVSIASLGQFGFQVFFLAALPYAPTTHVNLTAYLWPALVVLCLPLVDRAPFRPVALMGAGLGFLGVALLIWEPGTLGRGGAPIGYVLAFLCGASWAAYSLLRRFAPDPTLPTLTVSFACCAAGAAVVALWRGDALLQPPGILVSAAAIGLVPLAIANSAWDIAIRIGERSRAALLGYGVPVISTVLVVALTELEADWTLVAAAILVTLGVSLPEVVARVRPHRV
jgi:drug/metabolite transporter (DMT)-like permease